MWDTQGRPEDLVTQQVEVLWGEILAEDKGRGKEDEDMGSPGEVDTMERCLAEIEAHEQENAERCRRSCRKTEASL